MRHIQSAEAIRILGRRQSMGTRLPQSSLSQILKDVGLSGWQPGKFVNHQYWLRSLPSETWGDANRGGLS